LQHSDVKVKLYTLIQFQATNCIRCNGPANRVKCHPFNVLSFFDCFLDLSFLHRLSFYRCFSFFRFHLLLSFRYLIVFHWFHIIPVLSKAYTLHLLMPYTYSKGENLQSLHTVVSICFGSIPEMTDYLSGGMPKLFTLKFFHEIDVNYR